MKIKNILAALFFFTVGSLFAQTNYQKDFDEFWQNIDQYYAYADVQHLDWQKVRTIYRPMVSGVSDRDGFIRLLEQMLFELHNGHASLNTNLSTSNKLVPSGLDVFVEEKNGRFLVSDVRKSSGMEASGIRPGMQIVKVNGSDVAESLKKFYPKYTDAPDASMKRFALDRLFAGTHDRQMELTVLSDGKRLVFKPVPVITRVSLLDTQILNPSTALISIRNSLGNSDLIAEFDKTLDGFLDYKNIVIDLTDTPGGGNSTVARAIMGRFVSEMKPYQVHEFDEKSFGTKRHFVEYVSPRGKTFKGNVYILVGHWTGSMGEGMAIGFDGMDRATVIGTKMAGLIGAVWSFKLTESGIGYQIPAERLYHVNGTPRENYLPKVLTANGEETMKKASEIK